MIITDGSITKCKACGAYIRWIRTPAGKLMPCDHDGRLYRKRTGARLKCVTPAGGVFSCEEAGASDWNREDTVFGYQPHWATCTNPDRFRKR